MVSSGLVRPGDGDQDVVAIDGGTKRVVGLFNDGTEQFERVLVDRVTSPPLDLALSDVDGNGFPDLVVATKTLPAGLLLFDNRPLLLATSDDRDGDGLTGEVEICIADTDPLTFDTDAGGTGDGQELLDLTDPGTPDDDRP